MKINDPQDHTYICFVYVLTRISLHIHLRVKAFDTSYLILENDIFIFVRLSFYRRRRQNVVACLQRCSQWTHHLTEHRKRSFGLVKAPDELMRWFRRLELGTLGFPSLGRRFFSSFLGLRYFSISRQRNFSFTTKMTCLTYSIFKVHVDRFDISILPIVELPLTRVCKMAVQCLF